MAAEGWLAALVAPFAGACGIFIWNKVWTGDASSLNFVKNTVTSIGLLSVGLLTLGGGWLSHATPHAVGWLITSAFLGIVIGDNMWLYALSVLGARRVILIDILKPFIAVIFARLELAETVEPRVVLGMALTTVGVLIVSLEKEGEPRSPDTPDSSSSSDSSLLEVTSAKPSSKCASPSPSLCSSLSTFLHSSEHSASGYLAAAANVTFDVWGSVLTKQHGTALNTFEINFIRFGSSAAILALGLLCHGHFAAGATAVCGQGAKASAAESFPTLPLRAWAQILLGIMMTSFTAPVLSNFALFRIDFAVYSTIMCIGPIYALPLGFLIKGEHVTLRTLAGSVLTVLGVVPMFLGGRIASAVT